MFFFKKKPKIQQPESPHQPFRTRSFFLNQEKMVYQPAAKTWENIDHFLKGHYFTTQLPLQLKQDFKEAFINCILFYQHAAHPYIDEFSHQDGLCDLISKRSDYVAEYFHQHVVKHGVSLLDRDRYTQLAFTSMIAMWMSELDFLATHYEIHVAPSVSASKSTEINLFPDNANCRYPFINNDYIVALAKKDQPVENKALRVLLLTTVLPASIFNYLRQSAESLQLLLAFLSGQPHKANLIEQIFNSANSIIATNLERKKEDEASQKAKRKFNTMVLTVAQDNPLPVLGQDSGKQNTEQEIPKQTKACPESTKKEKGEPTPLSSNESNVSNSIEQKNEKSPQPGDLAQEFITWLQDKVNRNSGKRFKINIGGFIFKNTMKYGEDTLFVTEETFVKYQSIKDVSLEEVKVGLKSKGILEAKTYQGQLKENQTILYRLNHVTTIQQEIESVEIKETEGES